MLLRDLNVNSPDIWHQGRIFETNDIISFQPGSIINFNNKNARIVRPNNRENSIKAVSKFNVRK